jgi:osmotically-inducible protein OsmY
MHKKLAPSVCGAILALGCLLTGRLYAQDSHHDADSTAANRDSSRPTADQARNNMSDLDLMRHIRADVVKDKSLSAYAHNCKIVSDHGRVTLRGPVKSEDEKRAIEEHARKYAGDNVDNQLTVKEHRS